MTPAEIAADLREAARIVAERELTPIFGEPWCEGLDGPLAAISHEDTRRAFASLMYSDNETWGIVRDWSHSCVMALLFAAEFVERP